MPFFDEHNLAFAVTGGFMVLLILLLFRRVYIGFYDPFFIDLVYVGFSASFVFLAADQDHYTPLIIFLGLIVFLVSYRIGLGQLVNTLLIPINCDNARRPVVVIDFLIILIGGIAFGNFIINVWPNINIIDDVSNSRYLLFSNNKIVAILDGALRPIALVLFALAGRRKMRYVALAIILYDPVFALLLGSKGVIISLPFKIGALLYFVQVFSPNGYNPHALGKWIQKTRKKINYSLGTIILLGIMLTPLYLAKSGTSYQETLNLLSRRVLMGFDSAFFAVSFGMHFPDPSLSLLQMWFATPLKVVGLFTSNWDAINQFVVAHYMNLETIKGQFPTNFMILEVLGAFGPLFGLPFLVLVGGFYGYAIRYFAANRGRDVLHAIWFGLLLSQPLYFVIEGQGFITRIMICGVLSIFIIFLGGTEKKEMRLPLRKRAIPNRFDTNK